MKSVFYALMAVVAVSVSGCATSLAEGRTAYGKPTVYAGTRLNMAALNEDYGKLAIYKSYSGVEPPLNPAYDAPFSFGLDTLLLPMDALYVASDKIGLGRPSWLEMLAFELRDHADSTSKIDDIEER